MHYYLFIALQAFCLYHIYKNQKPNHWFFIILFIPVAGAIVYLITQVFTSGDVDKIQSEITSIINPTKKIKDLEKQLQFSDTYTTRIDLADAYFEINAYNNAVSNYKKTLEDEVQNPTYAYKQLIVCYYKLNDFRNIILCAKKIKNKSDFKGSEAQFYYGLALKEEGKIEAAELQLKEIDKPYSNYKERLSLAKLYLESNNKKEAERLLNDINEESNYMTKPNRKLFRETINEVERLLKTL